MYWVPRQAMVCALIGISRKGASPPTRKDDSHQMQANQCETRIIALIRKTTLKILAFFTCSITRMSLSVGRVQNWGSRKYPPPT